MDEKKYKILIVDDDDNIREILTAQLSKEPIFQILTAKNGKEGMYSAKINKPDLILLDIRMPEMNGTEVNHELKNHDELKDIPIIFLTSVEADDEILKDISDNKPAYYITKTDMNAVDLIQKIKKCLGI